MSTIRPCKIYKYNKSLAVVIPVDVCRALNLMRGDYLDLAVVDMDTMIAKRLKVVAEDQIEGRRDTSLPIKKYD